MEPDYWNSNIWLMSGEELKKMLPPPQWALFYSHYIATGCKLGASPAAVEAKIDKHDWEGKQLITKAVHEAARVFEEMERQAEAEGR